MFSCTHLWGWVRFWTIAGELEVRGTKLIYFPRLYTDCKYILSQMRHGVDKYISPEYIHILWPQSVPNNIWLPLTLSLPVYWHTNIFLVGGGRIGTTSGRKLRRGPEIYLDISWIYHGYINTNYKIFLYEDHLGWIYLGQIMDISI